MTGSKVDRPILTLTLARGDHGLRLDRVLLRHLSHLRGASRNRLQRLIATGRVTRNGEVLTRVSVRVQPHDTIQVLMPERAPRARPAPESLPLEIRFEDDHLLVVDKPPGQVAHPAMRHHSGTLLNALLGHAAGGWVPSLVSRLDRNTSGLVLVAKSATMHTALQRLAATDGMVKEYLAMVSGRPPARGVIDLALDRDPWDRRRVSVRDRGGVRSLTRFERLRTASSPRHEAIALLRCRLLTGRMHQIRVHLSTRGWPILGDETYGVPFAGLKRQALHAWRIAFTHPVTAEAIDVTAPPPPDLTGVFQLFLTDAPASVPCQG